MSFSSGNAYELGVSAMDDCVYLHWAGDGPQALSQRIDLRSHLGAVLESHFTTRYWKRYHSKDTYLSFQMSITMLMTLSIYFIFSIWPFASSVTWLDPRYAGRAGNLGQFFGALHRRWLHPAKIPSQVNYSSFFSSEESAKSKLMPKTISI